MEEVLKKIYAKLAFMYRKYIKRDTLILQVCEQGKIEKKKIKKDYLEKIRKLSEEREKRFLENHIRFNLNCRRLIKYKDKHLGQRCFIIGNGPSLKVEDLEKIKNEFSFAANMIYKIFPDTEWRPTYYFVEDSLAYKNGYKEIKKIKCPKFVSSIALEITKLPLVNGGIKFFDYLYYWDLYPEFPPLTVDLTKEVWCAYNVGYQMLNAAIYMGFKEIYLLGMDFEYDFSKIKKVVKKDKNGIEQIKFYATPDVSNHFTKDYLKSDQEIFLTDTKYALNAFKLLENESNNLGLKIFNATRGGKLEVFERVNFDDIIK